MHRNSRIFNILSLSLFAGSAFASELPVLSTATERARHSEWVGEYPDHGKHHFLSDGQISNLATKVLNHDTYKNLKDYQSSIYLEDSISFICGYYVLIYTTNYHLSNAHNTVVLIIREDLAHAHSAIIQHDDSGKASSENTTWRHYGEDEPPRPIAAFVAALL
jgi:hypothetical protein